MNTLALSQSPRYGLPVAANSATGFGDPSNLAHKRPIRQQALFLCLPFCVMAAVRGIPSGMPGSKFPVRQPAYSCHPHSFGDDQWQLPTKLGATPMTTRNPSAIRRRARAHRAMALAALRANTSRRHRQARYDNHIRLARNLERQYLVEVLDASGAVLSQHGPFPENTPIHDLEQRHPELTSRKVRVLEVSQ